MIHQPMALITLSMKPETWPKPNLRNPVQLLAFGFGSGCAPKAPGTAGSLLAAIIYLPLSLLPPIWYVVVLGVVILSGVWICDQASRQLGVHDHPGIVWDEFAGLWLTMLLAPAGWTWLVLGFVLFRLFDIWKPWPVGWLDQRIGGGLGVMLDDLVAGFYALILLQITARLL